MSKNDISHKIQEPENRLLKKGYNMFTTQVLLKDRTPTQDEVFKVLSSKPGTENINLL